MSNFGLAREIGAKQQRLADSGMAAYGRQEALALITSF
jgi:hypothetical protein